MSRLETQLDDESITEYDEYEHCAVIDEMLHSQEMYYLVDKIARHDVTKEELMTLMEDLRDVVLSNLRGGKYGE